MLLNADPSGHKLALLKQEHTDIRMPTLVFLYYWYFKIEWIPSYTLTLVMTIDFILMDFMQWFTTIYWLCHDSLNWVSSICSWLPPSQSIAFVCSVDKCLRTGCDTSWWKIRAQWYPLRYLPHQALVKDGITCFHQLVACTCIGVSWLGYVWMCAWETGALWGKRKMFKIRSDHEDGREIKS